jgi:hypothetical protein
MARRCAALIAAVLLFALAGCSGDRPEDRIRRAIAVMEDAAEQGRWLQLAEYVAEDFQGLDGQFDRRQFIAFLTLQSRRYQRLDATLLPIEVDYDGGNFAEARFQVLVTGGEGLLPMDGELYAVQTTWIAEGGDWRLWRADWRPALR